MKPSQRLEICTPDRPARTREQPSGYASRARPDLSACDRRRSALRASTPVGASATIRARPYYVGLEVADQQPLKERDRCAGARRAALERGPTLYFNQAGRERAAWGVRSRRFPRAMRQMIEQTQSAVKQCGCPHR